MSRDELLVAVDAAVEGAVHAGWPPGLAPARLIAKELGRDTVGVEWDHGGEAWRPSYGGVARIARELKKLEAAGLVVSEPGYPMLYTLSPDGDELVEELVE